MSGGMKKARRRAHSRRQAAFNNRKAGGISAPGLAVSGFEKSEPAARIHPASRFGQSPSIDGHITKSGTCS